MRWDIVKRLSLGALSAAIATALIPTYVGGISTEIGQIIRYSIAVSVLLTAIAALGHWWLGSIDWSLLGSLAARAVPENSCAACWR